MTRSSNLNGRVLEYLIVEAITENKPEATLTSRAAKAQVRDAGKLREMNPVLLQKLDLAIHTLLDQS